LRVAYPVFGKFTISGNKTKHLLKNF